jgi:hypothetical protein
MDYGAWVKRVSGFLRSLTYLPGELDLNDDIEAPGSDALTQKYLKSGRCSLPRELKAFIETASPRCNFRYRWVIPEHIQSSFGALFPGMVELKGGANFCEAARFDNYDNRDWFQNNLPPLLDQAAPSVLELFPPELRAQLSSSMAGNTAYEVLFKDPCKTDEERLHNRIWLLKLDNGDKVSLDLDAGEGGRAIVYVAGNDVGNKKIISQSFDQFLSDWEQLCYITPNLTNLKPWLDSVTGRLNVDSNKTLLLRELLTTAAAAQRSSS